MTTRRLLAFVVATCASVGAELAATMVVPADLGELAARASTIAHAYVSVIEPRVVPGRRAVERVVTFQVARYFKGDLGPEIRVRVPGGDLPPYRTVVSGMPRLQEGDEVVVFLGQAEPHLPHILGLSQGLYRVVASDPRGQRLVVPAMVLAGVDSDGPVVLHRGDRRRRPAPFSEFAAALERLLEEQQTKAQEEGDR